MQAESGKLLGWEEATAEPFTPIATYYQTMDYLLYLKEDVSYRADRVDKLLTLLWHPHEENLVGIQLKGFRYVCREHPLLSNLARDDDVFLPLAALVASLFLKDEAETLIRSPRKENVEALMKKYDDVEIILSDIGWAAMYEAIDAARENRGAKV
jgi:hypothetical protein